MSWWERLLHAAFPPRTGLDVDEPNPLALAVPPNPASVIRAMALLAGPESELYWEGRAGQVLGAWLRRQAGDGERRVAIGITPVQDFYHLPASHDLLAELAERLERAPSLPERVRLHLHDEGRMVLEWRRAFRTGPILVSRRMPEDRLAAFVGAIGGPGPATPNPAPTTPRSGRNG